MQKAFLRQTAKLKPIIRKHKFFCKKFLEHIRNCSRMKVPILRIYPFSYANKKEPREFKEKSFIMRWTPFQ